MDTVLLIEDESEVRNAVASALMRRHYEVIQATSLAEGRKTLTLWMNSICVVVSDINLRDGNSNDLHREVKDDILARRQIGWVAMTGHAESQDIEYFAGQGVTVLRKPPTIDQLVRAVQQAIKRSRPDPTP